MKKLSFDFDGTLKRKDVQNYAKEMHGRVEMFIVTARLPILPYGDIYREAAKLGIPKKNIKFVWLIGKVNYFKKHPVTLHLDNNGAIVHQINKDKNTRAVDVYMMQWQRTANQILL